ncbi:hypothetical protein ACFO3U_03040 [Flavobacterium ponti]|uniref:Lipoprotein n=1 Tax=Flavobacterium ponti TaxID=665133 RepID=A0ABV9P2V1_9FLAO
MRKIFLLLICTIVISCKSSFIEKGKYKINSANGSIYEFDTDNNSYTYKNLNGTKREGKFKIVHLNKEKVLLICNDLVFKKNRYPIKELNQQGDSLYIGSYSAIKNLGATIFEINICNKEKITFRKTNTNDLENSNEKGILIRL